MPPMSIMRRISRVFLLASAVAALGLGQARAEQTLPNILWITSEDNGPHLGCYGDTYAVTPNLDRFAKRSLRYTKASSTAPVCAPARTTIISGIYPPATGSEHMRSMTRLPGNFKMYPAYLRQLGYYCTNNSKEDYNLEKVGEVWNGSGRTAHWKSRPDGKPFFAIFNHTISHESQIRNKINPADRIHDPAKVSLPAYHPDTPEVRKDWAQYHDRITMMDKLVGKNLRELEEAGLADDTIVFYYGDHGSGMPRSKRWPYFSGLNVPLIIHVPEKFKHLAPPEYKTGGTSDRLVGFIDLAPTLLSIAGSKAPAHMQGHAFMGQHTAPAQKFSFGFRGRMDERYDMVRTVFDGRHIYIRNYMPHKHVRAASRLHVPNTHDPCLARPLSRRQTKRCAVNLLADQTGGGTVRPRGRPGRSQQSRQLKKLLGCDEAHAQGSSQLGCRSPRRWVSTRSRNPFTCW